MEWKDITIEAGQEFANAKQQQINKEQMRLTAAYHMKYGLYKVWRITNYGMIGKRCEGM